MDGPTFDQNFRDSLLELIAWRRDVRRFRSDPVPDPLIQDLIQAATRAPSVGYSQPWRFVRVGDPLIRKTVRGSFLRCNQEALASYSGERAKLYAELKLSGLDQAPEQLAIFTDTATDAGQGLGRKTMPEMLEYSTVMACHTFWLVARAYGIGAGWVSILDPQEVHRALRVPESWKLIAYFCVGYPEEEHTDPELARHRWEEYRAPEVLRR